MHRPDTKLAELPTIFCIPSFCISRPVSGRNFLWSNSDVPKWPPMGPRPVRNQSRTISFAEMVRPRGEFACFRNLFAPQYCVQYLQSA